MMTVKQRLGTQTQKPTGVLGWAAAGLMLVVGPSDCHHQAVAGLLDLQPDDALLDIACESGLFLRRRAAHVRRVAGLDYSSVQISLARRLLCQRIDAGTAEVVEGDAAALPWPDTEFSAVTCNCLFCIADAERAAAEMYRVLRPEVGWCSPRTSTPIPRWRASMSASGDGGPGLSRNYEHCSRRPASPRSGCPATSAPPSRLRSSPGSAAHVNGQDRAGPVARDGLKGVPNDGNPGCGAVGLDRATGG